MKTFGHYDVLALNQYMKSLQLAKINVNLSMIELLGLWMFHILRPLSAAASRHTLHICECSDSRQDL